MRAWEDFLTSQEKELGADIVEKWLRPLKILRFDACNLYLEATDSFALLWFEEHMRHRLDSLVNNNKKKIKIHITLAGAEAKEPEPKSKKKSDVMAYLPKFTFDELNPAFRLENFELFSGNLLAFKLLQEAVQSTVGQLSFNPIYLFGRKGSGKTHLLEATCNALRQKGEEALYVRAETFTEHVVSAIRSGEMQAFRKCYRNLSALIIDDIEVLAKKGATQEELFHTFNTLHVEGKKIILSASSSPKDLKFIEMRLISRFEWGIVIPLETLPKEEMKRALYLKAKELNCSLNEEMADFFLRYFSGNMKSLTRALEAFILRSHLNHSKMTPESAKELLSDLIQEEEHVALTPLKIIKAVAMHYGIKIEDILSKSQSREATLPRQIAMHLCRSALNLPFMKIGDIFARDHSTVMSSVKLIQKGVDERNADLTATINAILRQLEKE